MSWIDTLVVGIIIVASLVVMYKALKEPLDLLFAGLKKGIIAVKDMMVGAGENVSGGYETISYG